MTVTAWLIEECRRRIALAEGEAPEAQPPGKTFAGQIDELPGRGFHDLATRRACYRARRKASGASRPAPGG